MNRFRFLSLALAFVLTLALLDVPALAAGTVTVELSGKASSGLTVDLKDMPTDCLGFQATIHLDRKTAAEFVFDGGLSGSGIHCAYTQTETSVTLYVVSKQTLSPNGILRLGVLRGDNQFAVSSVSDLKLLDGSLRESSYSASVNQVTTPGGDSTPPTGKPDGTGGSNNGQAAVTYRVNLPDGLRNGTVEVSSSRVEAGKPVTVFVTPNSGYVLDYISAVTANSKTVPLTELGKGRYSFVMPASAVTIQAAFVQEKPEEPEEDTPVQKPEQPEKTPLPFLDVPENMWYYDAVSYAYGKGLMNGVSGYDFAPDGVTTRGQIVTILYRLEGEPAAAASGRFSDVTAGQWYTQAVEWAASQGIVDGYGTGAFGPEDNITREQLAAILYRYTRFKGTETTASGNLNIYSDAGSVSAWATEALSWANGAGLVTGKNGNLLDPLGSATRAEVATILMRMGAGN